MKNDFKPWMKSITRDTSSKVVRRICGFCFNSPKIASSAYVSALGTLASTPIHNLTLASGTDIVSQYTE